jgi:hypothetical protein
MNRHGVLKVPERRAHSDINGKPLKHLVGTIADDVATDDGLLLAGRP